MKIRQGFVSNSSSSSFLLVKDDHKDTCVTIPVKVNINSDVVIETETDVDNYMEEWWDCRGDADYNNNPFAKDLRDEMLSAIKNNKVIIGLEVDSREENLREALFNDDVLANHNIKRIFGE